MNTYVGNLSGGLSLHFFVTVRERGEASEEELEVLGR